ncbi:MAG: hypothetical protein ACKOSR_03250, partial [Flavobacteriales bacterium]
GTPAGTPPRILELRGAYGGRGDAGFVMLSTTNSNTSRVFELRWYNNPRARAKSRNLRELKTKPNEK